jgi:UDP-glucuronate 4-epimerase
MLEGKVLVLTGLTGRVGGAFASALASDNEVHGLARFTEAGQREHWESMGITTHLCDLGSGDFSRVPPNPDFVIHVAANTAPRSPMEGLRDNAEGSGLLMHHCRRAKAFLHVSTTGVYLPNPDPLHLYREDVDVLGGGYLGHYTGSKLAGEGAVRVMARVLELPLVICRLDVQYGISSTGGQPVARLGMILRGEPIRLPKSKPVYHTPVSDEDLVAFIEPCLNAATRPPLTVNWGGDEAVRVETYLDYMADLTGVRATYEYSDDVQYRSCNLDNTRRLSITGPCQVHWKDGLKRMVEFWAPKLRAGGRG